MTLVRLEPAVHYLERIVEYHCFGDYDALDLILLKKITEKKL